MSEDEYPVIMNTQQTDFMVRFKLIKQIRGKYVNLPKEEREVLFITKNGERHLGEFVSGADNRGMFMTDELPKSLSWFSPEDVLKWMYLPE